MYLKTIAIFIALSASKFHVLGNAQGFINQQFIVSHLNPDETKRVKASVQNHTKLIGMLTKYPLSFFPVKDSSGKVIRKEGVSPLIFWWTADRFNFDGELQERTISTPFFPNITLPDSYYEMIDGRFNLSLGFFVMTPKRNRLVDFTQPFFMEPLTLIIPNPVVKGDFWSAWRTFKPEVWILLFVSIVALAGTFMAFNCVYSSGCFTLRGRVHKESFKYIIEVLLNQGSVCYSKSLAIRLLAGVWCLAACVLVNTYNSTMTAHLLVSYPEPIIDSVFDLPEQSAVKLAVKKGSGTDFLLSTAEKGIYKQLGEMLQSQSKSRCADDQECLDLVRTGSYAYANPEFAAFDAMINAYRSTQKCEFTVIREYSLAISMAFYTTKNNLLRETVDRGILEMTSYGIIDEWIARHRPTLNQCPKTDSRKLKSSSTKNGDEAAKTAQISMKNLTVAFVVLAFGMVVAFCTLIGELLAARWCKLIVGRGAIRVPCTM